MTAAIWTLDIVAIVAGLYAIALSIRTWRRLK